MKTHAIIPIFIPHAGCPHDCVFCNQKAITARTAPPTLDDTIATIERNLATIKANPHIQTVEIAFFGGSFTGIPIEEQSAYLEIAKSYKDCGLIDKIHMSTRPDYINETILDNLKKYDADVIELGVQSFDDEVLQRSARGHSAEIVFESSRLIKEYGFTLGIQLMIGLPGDSYEKCMYSVEQTIKISPEIARLYPTVVIEDTGLFEMTKKGLYTPLSEQEAVMTTKDMYRTLTDAGINVIRVGLKSTDIITSDGGAVGAGSYHPAFRQLVESEIAKEDLEKQLKTLALSGETVVFSAHPESFSNMIGNKKSNRLYFESKYPDIRFRFTADKNLERGRYAAVLQR
jgi:histone acetyltransferase (RNA polymerase elongator complex component)